ncbi:ferritin 2 light chain [Arctopsyche grandis]|uniref:ferritin 2 light chain n=1 Tax=Arctopsyche grandis TaxID=121162 RepID=UPI00406D85C6
MKSIFAFLALYLAMANAESCYSELATVCRNNPGRYTDVKDMPSCNSKYSSFDHEVISGRLQDYAMEHIAYSYQYLLMAANFGNYQKNREGFQKLFQKLSDENWESSIDLIKHITKRGGHVKFAPYSAKMNTDTTFEEYELGSMAYALDIQKGLAKKAHAIHGESSKLGGEHHDPEIASFIEEKFVHKHSALVRDLAGHTNDLKKLSYSQTDSSLALFLFDEYLKS